MNLYCHECGVVNLTNPATTDDAIAAMKCGACGAKCLRRKKPKRLSKDGNTDAGALLRKSKRLASAALNGSRLKQRGVERMALKRREVMHLRTIASSLGALQAIARAALDHFAAPTLQEANDAHVAQSLRAMATPGAAALPPVEDGPADSALLRGAMADDPLPGRDVLTMRSGDSWRVIHCDVEAVRVAITAGPEGGPDREQDVARSTWPTFVREAVVVSRQAHDAERAGTPAMDAASYHDVLPRPALRRFAEEMEKRLREGDARSKTWPSTPDAVEGIHRNFGHVDNLAASESQRAPHAIDVANYAMFVWFGLTGTPRGKRGEA